MQKIIFITGLPGSGKSTYLENHKEEFGDALLCDDYYRSATTRPRRSVTFEGSAYYPEVREALASNKNVVIADIVFCEDGLRKEAQEGLEKLINELGVTATVEYRFFANDPEACIANILRRGRLERVDSELKFIADHKDTYLIPEGATTLPVYSPK